MGVSESFVEREGRFKKRVKGEVFIGYHNKGVGLVSIIFSNNPYGVYNAGNVAQNG